MKKVLSIMILLAAFSAAFSFSIFAQAKKNVKKTFPTVAPTPSPTIETSRNSASEKDNPSDAQANADSSKPQEPQKKNQNLRTQNRPAKEIATDINEAKNLYTYEFSQPDFVVKHIVIKHDETGRGTISFEKRIYDGDPFTDPIQLSAAALERIKKLFQTLNFLDSTEDYQSTIRHYAHLGTMKISLKKDGRERTTTFDWSENTNAKTLTDEYKKISEQYIWLFDISVSLQNQPLEAPGLMDKLDTLLRMNQISDPVQLVPVLKKLGDDERIPLIARNHAVRIAKEIEKKANK